MDIIREYTNISVKGTGELKVPGTEQANRAEISILSGALTVNVLKETGGTTNKVYSAHLTAPQKTVVRVENANYLFQFTGTGSCTVEYRGGML